MNYDDLVRRLGYLQYDTCDCELCVKFRESRDAIQELQRDALRWRFLRNQQGTPTPEEFDALIDADMQLDEAMQHEGG